jgi:hypothetical protein
MHHTAYPNGEYGKNKKRLEFGSAAFVVSMDSSSLTPQSSTSSTKAALQNSRLFLFFPYLP